MTFATPPPGGASGVASPRGDQRASAATDELPDRAVHGIFVGCAACAPFWLALLALTFRY